MVVGVVLAACGRTELILLPPEARISPPQQTARVGQQVLFDGRQSEDPEGLPLQFHWRAVSLPLGSFAQLEGLGTSTLSLTPDAPGDWVLELVVTAGDRTSRPAYATLSVLTSTNRAPVALVSGPNTIALGQRARFDGSASFDPDGDTLTFAWEQVSAPPGAPLRPPTPGPTFEFTPTRPGDYRWNLVVVDPFGARATAPATLHVFEVVDAGLPDAGTPVDAGTDALDPTALYLLGTVTEGTCGRDALTLLSTPDQVSAGFPCDFNDRNGVIHPQTKRLLYIYTPEQKLREYTCDSCDWTVGSPWPDLTSVLHNDRVIPTCLNGGSLDAFLVSPDGVVVHRCGDAWHDASGAAVSTEAQLLALGRGGWALGQTQLENLETGARRAVVGLVVLAHTLLAVRWREPGSFFVALRPIGAVDPELWSIDTADGRATRLGVFPAVPPLISAPFGEARLDPDGRLYQQAHDDSQVLVDVVIRRSIGGAADVVYTEASRPLVRINGSSLVTGP